MRSPARIASASPQRVCTHGRPRRVSARSMMSSWTSVKLWNISTASAAGRARARASAPPNASAASRSATGRMRLPPDESA